MNSQTLAQLRTAAAQTLKKYRAALLIFLIGLALALMPVRRTGTQSAAAEGKTVQFSLSDTQTQMEAILSQIDGAGSVRLLLTLRTGEETIYQTDTRTVTNQSGTTQERETVFHQTGSAQKQPVVQRVDCPQYMGALVLCQGADQPSVRLAITEAVASLTGLGSNKIAVVKLKGQ